MLFTTNMATPGYTSTTDESLIRVLSLNSKFCSIRASILEQGYHMGFRWLMTNVLYWMTILAVAEDGLTGDRG